MKPVGYQPGVRYPAILHIHGGPRTVFGGVFHHEMQVWANAGYFVFYCNPRGSDGRGNAFGDICGKYGTVEYENLMEFLDEMLAKYPDVDPERLGVTGGSYGGFMTNWIIRTYEPVCGGGFSAQHLQLDSFRAFFGYRIYLYTDESWNGDAGGRGEALGILSAEICGSM